jgi:protease I
MSSQVLAEDLSTGSLAGRLVVVLAFPDYQELELWYPVLRAREEGAAVRVVGPFDAPIESFLGYPLLPDTEAGEVAADDVDALVVTGTVSGRPAVSPEQTALLKAVHAAGRPVFASGTGADLVREVVLDLDPERVAPDADALPVLVSRLRAELAA